MANQKDIWDELERTFHHGSLDEEMFELLSAYLDQSCSDKERRLVEAYLEEIPRAEQVLAELRSQSTLIRASEEPPPWLKESILSKTTQRRSVPILALRIAPVAAAIVSLVVFGDWFLSNKVIPRSTDEFTSVKSKVAVNLPPPSVKNAPFVTDKPIVKKDTGDKRNTPKLVRTNGKNLYARASKPDLTLAGEPKRGPQGWSAPRNPSPSEGVSEGAEFIQRQRPLPDAPDVIGLIRESPSDEFSNEHESVLSDSNAKEEFGTRSSVTISALAKLRERLREINSKELKVPAQSYIERKAEKSQQEKTNEGTEPIIR